MENSNNGIFYSPQNSVPMNQTVINQKKNEPMCKRDNIFNIIFFACAFILINFASLHVFTLGFTISYFIIFIASTVYLFRKNVKVSVFTYICGLLSLAGSITFSLYSDTLINLIMLFLICALFCAYCCGLSGTFRHGQGSFKILFDMLLSVFVTPFSNMADTAKAFTGSMKANKKLINAIIGAAVSIPVLLVIVPLLTSSDAAFEGLVSIVIKNIGEYIFELLLAAVITPYIVSFMYSKRAKLNFNSASGAKSDSKRIPYSVSASFLCVISVTYVVYLFSQLAYFFSSFSGILPSDYKYSASAFARRGFFEMFAICVINIAILSIIGFLTKRNKNGKVCAGIKALSAFILLFSVLLIITAMSKMKLNIEIYGLSKNRLLVCVFMIMLLIIIAFNIVHIYAPKLSYMQPIIVICSAIFIAVSFADIDAVVAKYNVEAYQSGKIETVDIDYLAGLSDSAVPYMIKLADDKDLEFNVYFALNDKIDYANYLTEDDDGKTKYNKPDFRKFNMSTDKACRAIRDFNNKTGLTMQDGADEDSLEFQNQYLDYCFGIDFIKTAYTVSDTDAFKTRLEIPISNEYEKGKLKSFIKENSDFCSIKANENYKYLSSVLKENFNNVPDIKNGFFSIYNGIAFDTVKELDTKSIKQLDMDYYTAFIYDTDSSTIYIYDYSVS